MAPAKPQVQKPSTIEELRRLSHAFLAGSAKKPLPGRCVWIVASTIEPLRRIQGVYDSEAEAANALAEPVDPRRNWSEREEKSRVIYELCAPEATRAPTEQMAVLDEIDPWQHLYTDIYEMSAIAGTQTRRDLADMASADLTVRWTDGTSTTYTAAGPCDAIFISRGALDLFAMPMYAAAYGPEYVEELRRIVSARRRS